MLFDVDNLCWDEKMCEYLNIPMSILPEVKPSSMVYGNVAGGIIGLEDLEGIPIAGAIGDQPAALFGQACFEHGQAKNTYGTGCFLLMNTGEKRVKSKNNLLTGVAWGIGDKALRRARRERARRKRYIFCPRVHGTRRALLGYVCARLHSRTHAWSQPRSYREKRPRGYRLSDDRPS